VSAGPPNARNTKICWGFFRNGLHYSDVRQLQGPCYEIWVIKAPELLTFVGHFPRAWSRIFKMYISKNLLLTFSWQLYTTYSLCTTVALCTKLLFSFSWHTIFHSLLLRMSYLGQTTPAADINHFKHLLIHRIAFLTRRARAEVTEHSDSSCAAGGLHCRLNQPVQTRRDSA
jgi:hypothetical protein